MPISALPTPPSRSDSPQDFSDRADALLGALPGFVTEANALQSDVNAKEASASSYATIATDKAAEAQASANTASTKAGEAAAAAIAAAAAASNAEIAFDSFDDKYLGSKASDPATDNDGNALLVGALYWNTTVGAVRVWNGSAWLSMAADASIVDFQQSGAGAVVRTAQDKMRDLVSIKDFGAVGDGVTDDTAAIQSAINALPLNTADAGILTPKGFANGGLIYIPRGRYKVSSKIVLRRGVRICGESRESSQIVSFIGADSVFQYTDNGRYIQDEIVFENLSIWQDSSVTATAGAAIDVIEGPATVDSVYLKVDNCLIEGTYYGIRLAAGVGCNVSNSNVFKCGKHGFWQTGAVSTTSTVLSNNYFHQCLDNGVQIDGAAYVSIIGGASDSNTGHGYKLTGKCVVLAGCGAEGNTLAGVQAVNSGSLHLSFFTIANGTNALIVDNCQQVTLTGCDWDSSVAATPAISHINAVGRIASIGTIFRGTYAENHINIQPGYLEIGANNGLVGASNKWAIGATQQPETDTTFAVTGEADAATRNGLKAAAVHTASGTRNVASWVQFVSKDSAVTYPLVIGQFVPGASKGAAATHTRSAGVYVSEQTTGTTANANMMIDAGVGTVPVGNWSLYSDSTRDSVFKGPVRVGSLGSTAPMVTSGSGSPEGVVTAPVGSLYMRTDGGAGTSLYVKQSGTGNTGWAAK